MSVKITDLGSISLPLTGTEQLEIVDSNGLSRRVSSSDLSANIALQATFVTVTANPDLPNERILTAGTNISIVDGGPGLPVTVSGVVTPGGVLPLGTVDFSSLRWDDGGGVWIENTIISLQGASIFITEGAAALVDQAGRGQFWVRDDVPNLPMFTDDTGQDFELTAGSPFTTPLEILANINTATPPTTEPVIAQLRIKDLADDDVLANIGFDGSNVLRMKNFMRGGGIEITSEDAGGVDRVLIAADPDNTTSLYYAGIRRIVTEVLGRMELRADDATVNSNNYIKFATNVGTAKAELGFAPGNNFTISNLLSAGSVVIDARNTLLQARQLAFFDPEGNTTLRANLDFVIQVAMTGEVTAENAIVATANADVAIYYDGVVKLRSDTAGIRTIGSVYIDEQAAASLDIAGRGQLWVRNDVPNVLVFTDDTGVDSVLGGGFDPAANQIITGDWEFQGQTIFNNPADDLELQSNVSLQWRNPAATSTTVLQSLAGRMEWGVSGAGFGSDYIDFSSGFDHIRFGQHLYISEQVAALGALSGRGQLWVRDDTPNSLMFTNDNGNDFFVAGLGVGGDISSGSAVIAGTGFIAVANVTPRINTNYFVMASVEVVAPAADDINIQLLIDTNARFYGTLSETETDTINILEGQLAEVVTNNVFVSTSGIATPGGTYVTIIGRLIMGGTTGTMSLRIAKALDTGADGFAIRGAITLIPIDPQ